VEVSSDNTSSLTISSLNIDNMGDYQLTVTNSVVPDLTLTSEIQKVLATAHLSGTVTDKQGGAIPHARGALLQIGPGAYETVSVFETEPDGSFAIEEVVLGNFLLQAEQDIERYLPSYFQSTIDWQFADILELRDNRENLILALEEVPPVLTPADGENIVSGLFESDFGDDNQSGRLLDRKRVSGAGVSVSRSRFRAKEQDDGYELIAYVLTDENGEFEMNNLPEGDYRLNIQYPGIPMDPASFVDFHLGGGSGVEQTRIKVYALATKTSIVVTKVEETGVYLDYFKGLTVYPNPTTNFLTIRYQKLVKEQVVADLLDLTGQVLTRLTLEAGSNKEGLLDVTDLQSGVYFLRFYDASEAGYDIITLRVIVAR